MPVSFAAEPATDVGEQCPVVERRANTREPIDLSQTPVKAKADHSQMQGENIIELREKVRVRQDGRELSADYARINQEENRLKAEGNVVLSEPGIELKGSELDASLSGEDATLTDAQYRLTDQGVHGKASRFEAKDQTITLDDATFTSCPEGDTGWQLSADQMVLDQAEGWGESWNTVIKVADLPVFYVPWMTFPIDDRRRSGFLFPSIGYDADNGVDITTPYYLNLAPHYDATLSPRIIQRRGVMLGSEFRYLTDSHNGVLFGEYLPDDNLADDSIDPNRWSYQVEHRTQFNRHWYGLINAADVSDDLYFEDLGRNIDIANQNTVTRSGILGFQDRHWRISLEAFEADALQTTEINQPYSKLPDVRLSSRYPKFLGPLSFNLAGSVTSFSHDLKIQGDRVDMAPQLSLPLEWIWGFIIPSAKYRYTEYELEQTNQALDENQLTRETPIYSLDTGMFFERDAKLFGRPMVQTLEPRLYYLNVPFRAQSDIPLFDTTEPTASYSQLFRDNRFIGADRQGDADQLSVGISTRFLSADGGVEWARVSVAQAQYFADRQVQLNAADPVDTRSVSPYFLESTLRFSESWQLRGMTAWDGETETTVRSSVAVHYEPDERHIINLEHRMRNERDFRAEQAAVSFAWPIAGRWNLIGRYQHDLELDQGVDTLFGIEYEACCWGIRLVSRRYLNTELDVDGFPLPGGDDYKDKIYFQFVFKGLGGAGGSGLRTLLKESIEGYEDRLTPR